MRIAAQEALQQLQEALLPNKGAQKGRGSERNPTFRVYLVVRQKPRGNTMTKSLLVIGSPVIGPRIKQIKDPLLITATSFAC
jgi:hypothetical protein